MRTLSLLYIIRGKELTNIFCGLGLNVYLCVTNTTDMIENVFKKFLKGKVYKVEDRNLIISYKVNVNVKVAWNNHKYIDLNIKVTDCRIRFYHLDKPMSDSNILLIGNRGGNSYIYKEIKDTVRNDLNKWLAPMFSTHFYKKAWYTYLCPNVEVRINNYTYR